MTEKEAAILRRDGRIYIILGVGLVLIEKVGSMGSLFKGGLWDGIRELVSVDLMLTPCVITGTVMTALGIVRLIRGLRK